MVRAIPSRYRPGRTPPRAAGRSAEQDDERDDEAEEARRFGGREAEQRRRRDLGLRGRVAGDRRDERGEDAADADTGADERDAGEAGADHLGGGEIHGRCPLLAWSVVEIELVA